MSQDSQQSAFAAAIAAAYSELLRSARRLTGNTADAQDLVQAAMERALSRQARFRFGASPNRWIARIMRRLFIDEYRHGRVAAQLPRRWRVLFPDRSQPSEFGEPDLSTAAPAWESFSIEDVRRAATLLGPTLREPYVMFSFEHRSYAEVGARLSLAPGTVASRVSRARLKLRELLLSGAFTPPPPTPPSGNAAALLSLGKPAQRRRSAEPRGRAWAAKRAA